MDIVIFMGIRINFILLFSWEEYSGLISFVARYDCQEHDRNVKRRLTLHILLFHRAFSFIECYTTTNALSIQ